MISVRAARDEELDEILGLDRLLLSDSSAPSEDTDWWGAWDGAELVGYAGGRLVPEWPGQYYLSRAGVAAAHRGRGIQKRLIRCRVARAKRLLATRAVTYTIPYNPASMNSLLACGFRVYNPAVAYAGSEMVYWRKVLA